MFQSCGGSAGRCGDAGSIDVQTEGGRTGPASTGRLNFCRIIIILSDCCTCAEACSWRVFVVPGDPCLIAIQRTCRYHPSLAQNAALFWIWEIECRSRREMKHKVQYVKCHALNRGIKPGSSDEWTNHVKAELPRRTSFKEHVCVSILLAPSP